MVFIENCFDTFLTGSSQLCVREQLYVHAAERNIPPCVLYLFHLEITLLII